METYLDVNIPEDLCRHLFLSFVKKTPPGQVAPNGGKSHHEGKGKEGGMDVTSMMAAATTQTACAPITGGSGGPLAAGSGGATTSSTTTPTTTTANTTTTTNAETPAPEPTTNAEQQQENNTTSNSDSVDTNPVEQVEKVDHVDHVDSVDQNGTENVNHVDQNGTENGRQTKNLKPFGYIDLSSFHVKKTNQFNTFVSPYTYLTPSLTPGCFVDCTESNHCYFVKHLVFVH